MSVRACRTPLACQTLHFITFDLSCVLRYKVVYCMLDLRILVGSLAVPGCRYSNLGGSVVKPCSGWRDTSCSLHVIAMFACLHLANTLSEPAQAEPGTGIMKVASLFTGAGASVPVGAAPGAYSLRKARIFGHNAAALHCHAPQVSLNNCLPCPAGAGGLDLGLQQVGACACCCR